MANFEDIIKQEREIISGNRCRQCKSSIPIGARICKECKSYQDWRGSLGLSATVLALLVALLSVSSSTIPVISRYISPDINVSFSNAFVREGILYFVVTNTGRKAAVLDSIYWSIDRSHAGDALILSNASDYYMPPGSKLITTDIRLIASEMHPITNVIQTIGGISFERRHDVVGKVSAEAILSDGTRTSISAPLRRSDISQLIVNALYSCSVLTTADEAIARGCGSRELLKKLESEGGFDPPKQSKAIAPE